MTIEYQAIIGRTQENRENPLDMTLANQSDEAKIKGYAKGCEGEILAIDSTNLSKFGKYAEDGIARLLLTAKFSETNGTEKFENCLRVNNYEIRDREIKTRE